MPKIGMSSSAVITMPWQDAVATAIENGFDACEINCLQPLIDLHSISRTEIEATRLAARNADLELCVHAPFYELNIAAFNKGIREASVREILRAVDLCCQLGGKVVIVHPGRQTYDLDQVNGEVKDLIYKAQWDHNIDSLKTINHYAASNGIVICLENMVIDNHIDRTFEDLLDIRQAVGTSLMFTLDIGHARLTNGAAEGVRLLGGAIRHIHFTDNFGKKDDHLIIGEGNSDYSGIIRFVKQFPYIVTLEVTGVGDDPAPMVKSLRNFKNLVS